MPESDVEVRRRMNQKVYIACDLGAESGRVMAGILGDSRMRLEQIHRFTTPVIPGDVGLHWDVDAIWGEIKNGLKIAAERFGNGVLGISVDAWGVDYALIDRNGQRIAPAFHYRDARTAKTYSSIRERLGAERLFSRTGIQFMPINTLYQLAACDLSESLGADRLLLLGDYFNFRLSGVAVAERSSASTTQLYDPRRRDWCDDLISEMGWPRRLFPPIVPSGTVLSPLKSELASELSWGEHAPDVIATCTHDTGAAVAATPAEGEGRWAFISSGTWSLMGIELPEPWIDESVRAANFTNEAGYGGTIRFLKNLTGLWIMQELRRGWSANGEVLAYELLMEQAISSEPFRSLIVPSHPEFAASGEMAGRIVAFCRATSQPQPQSVGQFVRCVLESLALQYRATLNEIERLLKLTLARIHVVGGGSQSELLNQFTANATGRPVIAGPVEATAAGNVLIQAIAKRDVGSIAEARRIVRESFPSRIFQPSDPSSWQRAMQRYSSLSGASA